MNMTTDKPLAWSKVRIILNGREITGIKSLRYNPRHNIRRSGLVITRRARRRQRTQFTRHKLRYIICKMQFRALIKRLN